ncbi:UDP-2,4-diacetamido-2,4,6-trideoxy-beta-L-altropyranose hydrolase [Herbaspirillum robiniae]|uniref:UDP-2,4-diacetamido-2,4, 6-trideoxy-beta-L-altropyranose hydrolase n=1 Tax=Herbaspirillum robiniae TaxID=2014887 RepID=A0ABX2LXG6_9BURK|nr:UDP-2,4-diacetamido-2,4,6-trideoxy-beta-L-altropyranose hydrolase [Herbaspirillum robiniae]NUU03187.1 UDP-2,4-diacetamido-2,4,6-trideoxy-beta-L-altropyranose hydrolase [Herbaspirillum robiniae]
MKIAIRADANRLIGTGHVMRCLALADQLKHLGAEVSFLARPMGERLAARIRAQGHTLHEVSDDGTPAGTTAEELWPAPKQDADGEASARLIGRVDWVIVDHYGLDARWEQALRPYCRRLLVIDDLANRRHDADVLLDQNLGRRACDYRTLVPKACEIFIGPLHGLLRPEFAQTRARSLTQRGKNPPSRLLITLGGIDKDNITGKLLDSWAKLPNQAQWSVIAVMGAQAPWLEDVRKKAACMSPSIQVLTDVSDMASLMAQSDLAIGAAGGTAWERCVLGLPTLMVTLADNQRSAAHALERAGCASNLDMNNLAQDLGRKLAQLADGSALHPMIEACSAITDGMGAPRLARHMIDLCNATSRVRPMQAQDLVQVLSWRNHPEVRRHMRTQHEITLAEHGGWFERASIDPSKRLLIVETDDTPIGFVQFSNISAEGVADWGFYNAPDAPRGTGSKLGKAALDYAFRRLDLYKVCGQALGFNEASIRFHRKLGFVQEGILRDQCLIADSYQDLVCFGMLSQEWLNDRQVQL